MRSGVVLAAGEATRLPNKTLLPLKTGLPAISSSLNLFINSDINDITIVVAPMSLVPDVLAVYYPGNHFNYVVQHEQRGYLHAVAQADPRYKPFAVTCCDNVYSADEVIDTEASNVACIRKLPPWQSVQLLKWYQTNNSYWSKRCGSNLCFAGYAIFEDIREIRRSIPGSVETFFNAFDIKPLQVNYDGWFDIGTLDSYLTYWRTT